MEQQSVRQGAPLIFIQRVDEYPRVLYGVHSLVSLFWHDACGSAGMVSVVTFAVAASLALTPVLENRFVRIDANGDGFISEHEAWADDRVERRFEFADRNQDGKLDRAEFKELLMGPGPARAS